MVKMLSVKVNRVLVNKILTVLIPPLFQKQYPHQHLVVWWVSVVFAGGNPGRCQKNIILLRHRSIALLFVHCFS
jgi:hypothetical protein